MELHYLSSLVLSMNICRSFDEIVIQHGLYLENWYLEAGRDLGTSEADTEVGVL